MSKLLEVTTSTTAQHGAEDQLSGGEHIKRPISDIGPEIEPEDYQALVTFKERQLDEVLGDLRLSEMEALANVLARHFNGSGSVTFFADGTSRWQW